MADDLAQCSAASRCEYKVFNDPIHGHIELHPLCVKIIDTRQFQRLRYIKQLGVCYYVFPGASHNRFEHSIGVCHLAGQLVRAIKLRQPELGITEKDVLCVQIAGLCHDLGHGPFSHMFEDFIHKMRPDYKWKHEQASVKMFEYLLLKNNLDEAFNQYGLDKEDITFIKEQIAGPLDKEISKQNWPYHGRDEQKSFLYEIVANKRNGIDVDKWDYFARDCHHLGIHSSFDHHRFMSFCHVISADGAMQICNRDKEVTNMYDMFYVRSILHMRAYQHKTAKVIEIMITEALVKADKYMLTEGKDGKQYEISKCIDDVEAFMKLTDTIYDRIMYSSKPELTEARDILHKIESRKLYKYIGKTKPRKTTADVFSQDSARIREQMASFSLKDKSGKPFVKPDDIIVLILKIDYGKNEENPIDSARFYTKRDPNKAVRIKKEQVSPMLPMNFMYKFMYVYSRKLDTESVQNVSICFTEWCKENAMLESEDGDENDSITHE